ncbi:MAG: hypothetical protein LKF01_00295 [Lactobacillus sp.]|jgi:hypothetical protein|nr:hypothetical protein [Lactobacillus sp.]MCH4067983.1 hypothetical protein [Lactobacillus sp.]MCI1304061.1 hypothetical protein [Lactobacillus sp.]MCI1329913.1 hypothetical protein [Lactobacillus sp.]MCI1399513.1 hypothetical protein [Lactobacillus sp.]
MNSENKVIQAIINNSDSCRPTHTYKIDQIKADAGLSNAGFDNVLESLENQGLLTRRYGSDVLSYLNLNIDFPK